MSMRLGYIIAFALVLLALIAGCGASEQGSVTEPESGPQLYEFSGTVLESRDRGPELCTGEILDSLPPQCGGIPIVGWDWNNVSNKESRIGTTWAEVYVQGTYDGETFTLTAPPGPPREQKGAVPDFSPACETPEAIDPMAEWTGGFRDSEIPGLVATWVTHPSGDSPSVFKWNGPFVFNVVVRPGFVADATSAVRMRWLGHLCVVERDQPLAGDLETVQRRLMNYLRDKLPRQSLAVYADERRGVVVAQINVVDDDVQQAVDEEFGPGIVELHGSLNPVP